MKIITSALALTTAAALLTACGDLPEDNGPKTVKAGDSEFTCKDVPQDVMDSIMQGDKDADGANAEVRKAQMVEGVDNWFIAAEIEWNHDGVAIPMRFSTSNTGSGPILSLTDVTAERFNWPYLEVAAKTDASLAVKDCI